MIFAVFLDVVFRFFKFFLGIFEEFYFLIFFVTGEFCSFGILGV